MPDSSLDYSFQDLSFAHRPNQEGMVGSYCMMCFQLIGIANSAAELANAEAAHASECWKKRPKRENAKE